MEEIYDIAVIGGGPAGFAAALYGARAGRTVLVLERLSAGGQMAQTLEIQNYPGFPDGVEGYALADAMKVQAERFGAVTRTENVTAVSLSENPKKIHTKSGIFLGKTVILATGANPRKLGLPYEGELAGRGVSYCAACDGMFYRGKTVVVVGGGNSAVGDALILSRIAEKVTLIHRRDALRAAKIHRDSLGNAENVTFLPNTVVTELQFGEKLTGIRVKNAVTGEEQEISCDGLFIAVGREPATELAADQLRLADGYLAADESTQTEIPGVFAVGDVRARPLRQIVTAVSDGATAAHLAEEFFMDN